MTQWRSCLQAAGRSTQAGHQPASSSPTVYHSAALQALQTCVCVFTGSQGKVSLHHKVSTGARSPYDTLNTMKFIYSVCLMDMREIYKLQILHLQNFRPETRGLKCTELV